MESKTLGRLYLEELESEKVSTRKCLERIPEKLFTWKPHEKSLTMIYTALIVAEIPKWISTIIESSEIDFATFKHFQPKTAVELVNHFEENLIGAKSALQKVSMKSYRSYFILRAAVLLYLVLPKKKI